MSGVDVGFLILSGLKAGADIISGESQTSALEAREQQEKAAYDQESIQRANKLSNILSSQVATAASQGIETSSPSFSALTEDEFNNYAKDDRAAKLSLQYDTDAYDDEIENAQVKSYLGAGESLFDAVDTTNVGQGINKSLQGRYR